MVTAANIARPLPANLYPNIAAPAVTIVQGIPRNSAHGFDKKGLPIGLQLIGNVLEEHRILNAANIFEIDAQVIKNKPFF